MIIGKHLVAGSWVAGEATFLSDPSEGSKHEFAVGTPELVERAAEAAEAAFWRYGYSSREERAVFLDRVADEIDALGDAITEIGTQDPANGFPTGVEVCDAMVHGGPYPASTNFGATSVGTLAIRRFLRPVCYQNLPLEMLPSDLH